jgi:hypothetical protein
MPFMDDNAVFRPQTEIEPETRYPDLCVLCGRRQFFGARDEEKNAGGIVRKAAH